MLFNVAKDGLQKYARKVYETIKTYCEESLAMMRQCLGKGYSA